MISPQNYGAGGLVAWDEDLDPSPGGSRSDAASEWNAETPETQPTKIALNKK